MDEKIKIYSYQKVWKVEKKVYAIMNLILPMPINPVEAASFLGAAIGIAICAKLLPFIAWIPGSVRYLRLPYMITRYMMKKKRDGKNPFLFLVGYMHYLLQIKGTYLEGWVRHRNTCRIKKIDWYCSRGRNENEPVSG